MKTFVSILAGVIVAILFSACFSGTPTPTPVPTAISTPTSVPPTATFTPVPTATFTPTPVPTWTPTPTPVPISKSASFKVPAGDTYEVSVIPPWDGASVQGFMQTDLDINFLIKDPLGNSLADWGRVTSTDFSFRTQSRGTYKLVFDNTFSVFTSKNVSVSYTMNWQ